MNRSVWLVAVSACAWPEAEEPEAAVPIPPPPACVAPVGAEARISLAIADGRRVRYCISGQPEQCFVIDPDNPDARSFLAIERPAIPPSTDAQVVMTPPAIDFCTPATGCVPITDLVLPDARVHGDATPSGAFATFLFEGTGNVEVWDVEKLEKRTSFRSVNGKCGDVEMLGETILLRTHACGTSTSRGALFKLNGKKIADVGNRSFKIFDGGIAPVDPTTWAFLAEDGTRVVVQDVVMGTIMRSIDTSAVFLIGGANAGNPRESALVHLDDGRLAVIAGRPAIGSIATVNLKTRAVEVREAPPCGATVGPRH